jgi:hypothetical protein
MTRTSLLLFTVALTITSSAMLIPQQAWAADLPLRPKPVVRQDPPSDWRTRLFEQFQRYQQRKNQ